MTHSAAAAEARIEAVEPIDPAMLAIAPTKRSEPRVAFSTLLDAGLISAGETLHDAKRRYAAKVKADGSLMLGPATGSIHKIGALAQGLPACNGWSFWHIERDEKLVSIDELRTEIRASMPQE